ncbi:DUF397 domain-containing protein [Actinomadura viridis]|uniref:DUF397 domain-containing protein n=1 Tax=Actinomadura viridis TaxID=58110 RepID=A0A931DK49_9ACTN|nr:DUF397 domain-containing protein [Actinomadura viridis]MBG6088500.1 hypothetical protein [Actinomadura viridis]
MSELTPPNARWRKSSHSGSLSGECVEVTGVGNSVALRDSKDPKGPVITLSPTMWRALRDELKSR